ncbi:MAG: L,D-transpeptidase family protein [Deltaproteobacteria bacterium]|nr:L,D-transpeptidase family protein [Deltaproteobacteria bacterium]
MKRLSLILGLIASSPRPADATEAAKSCPPTGSLIVVDTPTRSLHLCSRGVIVESFGVSLGKRGVGKRAEGDEKTPLGTYSLGKPRPSSRFGTFVPIGYPTKQQQKAGLTGRDVGLHGPERRLDWAGSANLWIDWTNGCVAVKSIEEIEKIAAWVSAEKVSHVLLR